MASLQVPCTRTTRSDSVISFNDPGDDSEAITALQKGSTGQLGTLIDLLNATAHDPDMDHDSDSDADDTDEAPTPADSIHHGHRDDAHVYDSTGAAEVTRDRPDLGARHGSISSLARKMHYSSLEDSEDLISLARAARVDDDEEADAGLDAENPPSPTTAEKDPTDTPEDMLANLVQEYGPWTDDSERFVMQIPGALYRDVLIKGLLALTNRRVMLYAFIPPPEPRDIVLKSGPVTFWDGPLDRCNALGKKTRVWVELRSDSVTWFASSAKLYKPLGSHRLSMCKRIFPFDSNHPNFVQVEAANGRTRSFEYDTAESAIQWRAEMEAALFTFRATADKLRMSLPLQYVTNINISPYGPIGEAIRLEFDTVTPCSDHAPEQPTTQSVQFGYLRTHSEFGDALKAHIEQARALPPCGGPKPILEIEPAPESANAQPEDSVHTDLSDQSLAAQFCRRFALPDNPADLYIAKQTEFVRTMPTWGSLALSKDYLLFWRKGAVGADVMYRFPLKDVEDAVPARAFGFKIWGLAVHIRGSHDKRFDFVSQKKRDEVVEKIKEAALRVATTAFEETENRSSNDSSRMPSIITRVSNDSARTTGSSTPTTPISPQAFVLPEPHLAYARSKEHSIILGQDLEESALIPAGTPMPVMPKVLGSSGRRKFSNLHFVCLTIGSRGDVQPYIALGIELMKDGNQVTIASHPEYRAWVESFGIGYRDVGGDPGVLMKLSVEHKMFSPGFFKESLGHFRTWLDELFHESWVACQGADVLIESPSTMAGIHVAEALGIPYFRAFTMPWTSTSAYPQAFASGVDLGPGYNLMSYSLYEGIIWKATAGQVNRWRKKELGLKSTSEKKMKIAQVPFIYNFSSAVVPRPNDWRDNITISGYWFLPPNEELSLTQEVVDFIDEARADGKPIIYVGFGSIVVQDAAALTRAVVAAVKNANARCILSKGWSERHATKRDEAPLPDYICSVPSVAHDLLFPLIDAACHHGGAGTTGASLRAGLPTLIHPFFGDQHFWASRVTKLGAGLKIDNLTEKDMTTAFKRATTERVMREKAEAIGVKIRSENGPRAALNFIYDHLHLAQVTSSARAARAAGHSFAEPRVQSQVFAEVITAAEDEKATLQARGVPVRASTLPISVRPFERSHTKLSSQSAPVPGS